MLLLTEPGHAVTPLAWPCGNAFSLAVR